MIKASELIGISGMDRPHVPPKISFLLFKKKICILNKFLTNKPLKR